MSTSQDQDPAGSKRLELEPIALAALEAGQMLLSTGAKAGVVRQGMTMIAGGLGADLTDIRVGFASIAVTVGSGPRTITRMLGVREHGVNMRLNHALRKVCVRVSHGGMTPRETVEAFHETASATPRYHPLLVCLAAGIACAAFGELLGIDTQAFTPVLLAGTLGQWLRLRLRRHDVNSFVMTALVAFVSSALAGVLAPGLGSTTIAIAMSAAVLMLVPGVPAINAQSDIMEGFPTLGSARAVSVAMVLVFLTVGVGFTRLLLGNTDLAVHALHYGIVHQMLFGAIAAAGFGVLFNFGYGNLLCAGVAGAIALGVRTLGLEAGWSLEAACFSAAVAVALVVEVVGLLPLNICQAGKALAVAGCIPMVPGSAAAQWIFGLFTLTTHLDPAGSELLLLTVIQSGLRVIFTTGAIGAGLTIVASLFRRPEFPERLAPAAKRG
ncbi:uncharacterized membrane protein YjjP (DUF1212 family) [Breoghania corrubedonensis]|uniref:Uncharacterized membrane protein YjjP (DUF1212 family) n=2 Tax=Breoghania corrubedonensis TaxID=665038 RepID=A0A2T5VEA2_9HYPH|nr:uncharacterized membrane protein YjjP (DUF1212 family) [Breoghania corrubedonensis]